MITVNFFVEDNKNELELETSIVTELLDKNKFLHTYQKVSLSDFNHILNDKPYIPIGTIPFVEKYLRKVYGIQKENPIEIPEYLRTDEFLKRDYKLMHWQEVPRYGIYFLKDVSNLKKFGKIVNATYEVFDELWTYQKKNKYDSTLVLDKDSLYAVSEVFHVLSEYRVYVFQREIEQISYYNGDCTVFPDIDLIKKAVSLINYNEKWLQSYTIDVMVGKSGTAIIEIHNFTSCGLYSTLWSNNLLQAYEDGIDYIINDNKELK